LVLHILVLHFIFIFVFNLAKKEKLFCFIYFIIFAIYKMASFGSNSIGFSNPIGFSPAVNVNILNSGLRLGGGLRGFIPQMVQTTDNNADFADTRFLLKEAWNTRQAKLAGRNISICTPFRAINNAGDVLSRPNYSCGGPCQTFQSRPGLYGLKPHFGAIQNGCDGTGIQPSSCNVKYVYDSSDYIRYTKQKAINKNYNDASYGGDNNSAAQSAIRAIRRY
jgi:hypothetical protein